MNALKLEHIAPYLPYGLIFKLYYHDSVGIDSVGCLSEECMTFKTHPDYFFDSDENEYEAKLVLYPIDYLTKPIWHDGKEFIPVNEHLSVNTTKLTLNSDSVYPNAKKGLDIICYRDFQKLIQWRFDVFGLIDKGLAIPVTENFNPYK